MAPRQTRGRPLFRFPWRGHDQVVADVDSELHFHLEMRTQELIARGMTPEQARATAIEQFGDLEFTKQYMRRMDMDHASDQRRSEWFGELLQDTRYAFRTLLRTPGFTTVAVLTLALGIGANTAIFSVVNGILLRPLPFPNPDRLLKVWSANPTAGRLQVSVSAVDLDDWRAQRSGLADMGGYWFQAGGSGIDMTGQGEPQRLSTAFVTPGFWSTLGVPALVGRVPRDDEMVRGGPDRVVVLAHAIWQRQFGSDPRVVGTTLTLGGEPYTVVGVMPPDFRFPADLIDVYIPYSTIPDEAIPRLRPVRILDVVARMKPGVTIERANAEMNAITRRLAEQYPEDRNWSAATVAPLHEAVVGKVRTGLLVLLGAVAFVLVMACVNVASLLLARATVREREVAIRAALGAARARLVRQLLTESLVLAIVGGVIGLGVALVGTRLLLTVSQGQLPRTADVQLDARVLVFALLISLLTGLLFGLVPALRASSPRLQGTLRESGRSMAGGASQRLRNVLVMLEVALAVILVVGAGLMTKSFLRLLDVDPGFRPERLLAVNFTISTERHPNFQEFYRDVIERVRAVPGVLSAGAAKDAPFRGPGERIPFIPPGVTLRPGEDAPSAMTMHISDGYFRTIGAPIISGREFTPQDRKDTPFVVVINQALAKEYFPNESPIGKSLGFGGEARAQIVGVVGDIRQTEMEETAKPSIYINEMQNGRVRLALVVRTAGEPLAMTRRVQEAIWSLDKQQPITSIFTFDQIMSEAVARPRMFTVLLGLFGGLGFILGALGIYGVLAYLVNQRRREIGVRIALGAQRGDVLRMVVGRGLALGGAGVVAGIVGALLVTRFMQGVLYGVGTTDPITFVGVALALLGVAALASWIPAHRATKVDPAVALRSE